MMGYDLTLLFVFCSSVDCGLCAVRCLECFIDFFDGLLALGATGFEGYQFLFGSFEGRPQSFTISICEQHGCRGSPPTRTFLMAASREVYRYMHVIQPSIFFRLFVCLFIVHACLYRTDDSSVCDCYGDITYTVEVLSTL